MSRRDHELERSMGGGGRQAPVELARLILPDAEATGRLGEQLGGHLTAGQGLALIGPLGAGKTCLARGVARGLSVDRPDEVASPTYLLVVEHPGPVPMVHVDAYLPDKARGFLLDGGSDYLAELGGVVVAEWADRIPDLMPPETLTVHLEPEPGGGRRVVLSGDPRRFGWTRGLRVCGPSENLRE